MRQRCALLLLLSLVVYLALLPVFASWQAGRLLLGLVNLLLMASGVIAVARTPRQTRVAVGVAAICAVLQIGVFLAPSEFRLLAFELLILPFYVFTIVSLLTHVLRPGEIGADRLYAAVSVYILFGFFWALGYYAVAYWSAGSFLITVPQLATQPIGDDDLLYFSFVSLTATGYGDIVAVSPLAHTMAVLQYIVGVMYVAILIARLAGLYSGRRPSEALSHG